jgi:hypothetical protein
VPCLLIPVHSVHGEIAIHQIRPDEPRVQRKTGKAIKYETAAGSKMALDVPPGIRLLLADPSMPLFVTEGVRKADSAVSKGLCCIAILGVWNWRGTNGLGGKTALPDWELVALNGRKVYLAFDSDVVEKRGVRTALLRLKEFLESRKATVFILRLPPGPGGTKTGLDDFFARGRSADDLLLTAAQDLPGDEARRDEGRFGRPRILLEEGDLHALTLETWRAIKKANPSASPTLFRHGGAIARIEPSESGGVKVEVLQLDTMRRELVRMVEFEKLKKDDIVSARPPADLVGNLLAWPEPPLPALVRLVHVPVFDASGRLIASEGYDACSGLYLELAGLKIPPVPDQPAASDLDRARDLFLVELLGDFPFARPADLANAVAVIIAPFVREMIEGPTPLHMIEKPSPGTGAGLLTEVLGIPALGQSPSLMTEGRDEDEWRKRITAILCRGPTFIVIDNVRNTLDSAALSAALTAPMWEDRILGHSRTVSIRVRAIWLATGNNPAVSHEVARRSVPIRLDAKMDQPWTRPPESFRHANLRQWAVEHRGELVWAALVLTRAWIAAGRPPGSGITLGSYEAYAQVLGGVLGHAGIPGFLANLSDFYERADREGEGWRTLIAAWWTSHGDADVGTNEVFKLIEEGEHDISLGHGNDQSKKTRLGVLLRQARDRRYVVPQEGKPLEVRLEHVGQKRRAARYRLAPEEAGEPGKGREPLSLYAGREGRRSGGEPCEPCEPFAPVSGNGMRIEPLVGTGPPAGQNGLRIPENEPELGGEGSPDSPGSPVSQDASGECIRFSGSDGDAKGSPGSPSEKTPPNGAGTRAREVFEL